MGIYFFDSKKNVTEKSVGGKGLSLIKMTNWNMNVPYGFVIPTFYWKTYKKSGEISSILMEKIKKGILRIEKASGKKFGLSENPLLISARSGARFSMPGMMETVLDIGINEVTLPGLIKQIGEVSAYGSYQQFLRMFGHTVLRIDHKLFEEIEKKVRKSTAEDLVNKTLTVEFRKLINKSTDVDLNDLEGLLKLCVKAVFESYDNPGAVEYRNVLGIPHSGGTAVIIQQMVFGNLSDNSGSAVIFSRDLSTGKKQMTGHFLPNSQGESVVRGYSQPLSVEKMPEELFTQLEKLVFKLEKEFKNVVDVEVTWEDYRNKEMVYVLQSRVAKVPPKSNLLLQSELVKDGLKSVEDIVKDMSADNIYLATADVFDTHNTEPFLQGSPLHTGVGIGEVVFDISKAKNKLKNSEDVVLVCDHFDPNDLELLTGKKKLKALITTEGGPSSHMGLVLCVLNIPGIMGVKGGKISEDKMRLEIGNSILNEGELISVDSVSGRAFKGALRIVKGKVSSKENEIISRWEKKFGFRNSWADFIDYELSEAILKQFSKNIKASNALVSKKAVQTYIVNTSFGKDIAIYTDIVDSYNEKEIIERINEIKKEGRSVWLRSAYLPDLLQSPYTSSDLTQASKEELESWIYEQVGEDKFSKFGKYQDWKNVSIEGTNYLLKYALIQHDRNDKLNKELANEHFVASLRCELSRPTRAVIGIFDGSPHTRVLGQQVAQDIFSIILTANKKTPKKIGNYFFKFGANCFNENIKNDFKETYAYKIAGRNGLEIEKFEEYVDYVNTLLENGQLPRKELEKLIQGRKLAIAGYVFEQIINWWGEYNLPTRMWALNKLTGASVLEFQGRLSENNNWFLIYGTKGQEEGSLANK